MGRATVAGGKPAMGVPVTGIALAEIAEGSLVKLNENGSPVEFYVAKHDYESGLNGAGRTLLVRKDVHTEMAWKSSTFASNTYSGSIADNWFNETYKASLDTEVQTLIATTKFRYTPGGGTNSVSTLSRSVFALSVTEHGMSADWANTEGSALPIASSLTIAYVDETAVLQVTRTPNKNGTTAVSAISKAGRVTSMSVAATGGYTRPAFTLPATALFDEETLEFKGVA
jgi:hypothetical protein